MATLGINPSASEFLRPDGSLLDATDQRLESLRSLGVNGLEDADDDTVARVVAACYGYFHGPNPFWPFFSHMEPLLNAAGVSYRDDTACHLDLVQWATDPLWSNITVAAIRERLLREDAEFLRRQLADTELELVLVNGAKAVEQVERVGGVWTERTPLPAGHGQAWLVTGTLEGTTLLGWTPYIPNGFVSGRRRTAILDAIQAHATASSSALVATETGAASGAHGASHLSDRGPNDDEAEADVFLLVGPDAAAAGLLVIGDSEFVIVTSEDLNADGQGAQSAMRQAWPPDGQPEGARELAALRRALAVLPAQYERHLLASLVDVEQALEFGLRLLGQLTGGGDMYAYRWPSGHSERVRASVGDRAELLAVLRESGDPALWQAATRRPWVEVSPSEIRPLSLGWQHDVLDTARDHHAGSVRDLALHQTGTMSEAALARPTSELGVDEALYLAGQPWTPKERLAELLAHFLPVVRVRILRRPDVSVDTLLRLAQDPDEGVGQPALTDPRVPAAELPGLLHLLPPRRAVELARDRRLPLDDPRVTATDLPEQVRLAVLARPELPAHVHDALAETGRAADRRYAAARCSGTLARRLLDDDDSGLRRAAASNPNLIDPAQLALDRGDLAVLTAVVDRDDVPARLARQLCLAVLRHPERNVFEAARPCADPGSTRPILGRCSRTRR